MTAAADQRLAGASRHLEQEAVLAFTDCGLEALDGLELIRPQEAKLVGLDVAGAFRFVFPCGLGPVAWPLGKNDVVVADRLRDEALRVGRYLLVADDRLRCWETK